jgi:GR25 family glycosyltransferase involved in LPS biosynthesis
MVFDFFNTVHVINRDDRPDRLENISDRLSRLNIQFCRYPAICPPDKNGFPHAGHHGAYLSHTGLWKTIQTKYPIFILEDDAVLRDDFADWIPKIKNQLRNVTWDILYFGIYLLQRSKTVSANISKVTRGLHFHAYCLNGAIAAEKCLAAVEKQLKSRKTFVDQAISLSDLKKYHVNPILAVQGTSHSNTGGANSRLFEDLKYFSKQDFLAHCKELRDVV